MFSSLIRGGVAVHELEGDAVACGSEERSVRRAVPLFAQAQRDVLDFVFPAAAIAETDEERSAAGVC